MGFTKKAQPEKKKCDLVLTLKLRLNSWGASHEHCCHQRLGNIDHSATARLACLLCCDASGVVQNVIVAENIENTAPRGIVTSTVQLCVMVVIRFGFFSYVRFSLKEDRFPGHILRSGQKKNTKKCLMPRLRSAEVVRCIPRWRKNRGFVCWRRPRFSSQVKGRDNATVTGCVDQWEVIVLWLLSEIVPCTATSPQRVSARFVAVFGAFHPDSDRCWSSAFFSSRQFGHLSHCRIEIRRNSFH